MKKIHLFLVFGLVSSCSYAQNVGIGIATPDVKLQVDSVIRVGKNATIAAGSGRKNTIKFGDGDFVYLSEQDLDDRLVFRAGSFTFKNGDVGIGIDSPDAKLQVDSVIRIGKNATLPPGGPRKNMMKFGDGDFVYISEQDVDDRMVLRAGSFTFRNGSVGIGIDAATADLDVNGTLRIRTTGGTGKVLTSDATGNATWQAPAATAIKSFLTTADIISAPNGTTVKIPFITDATGTTIGYDDFGTFNNGTSTFVVPATGIYQYNICVRTLGATASSNGLVTVQLFVNGSITSQPALSTLRHLYCFAGQAMPTFITSAGLVPLNSGDQVTVHYYQSSGASVDVFNNANSNFSMFRVK